MEPKKLFYLTTAWKMFALLAFVSLLILSYRFNIFGPMSFFEAVFISLLPFLAYLAFYWLILSKKSRKELQLYNYEWQKKHFETKIHPKFDLVKGEQIIFPMEKCHIIGKTATSYSEYPREVIVTNKRILVGLRVFGLRVVFGKSNFWHKDAKDIPSVPTEILGGNAKIKKIEYGKDENGEYVNIIPEKYSAIGARIKIYHPKAKKIFEIFSKPIEQRRNSG